MDRTTQKLRRDAFKAAERELLDLINEWAPLPGAPRDEFDFLVHHLIGVLQRGATPEEVAGLLHREIGYPLNGDGSSESLPDVAVRIVSWWSAHSAQ